MMRNFRVTIFTPTYNRASYLPRLYDSLIKQTNKEFIWIVVDDGSTDDTSTLVKKWEREGKIDIRYIYQENAGKMIAHNRGVIKCETDLFMCLDSDDYLSDDCVEKIYYHWNIYKDNPKVSGMVAYRKMIGRTPSYFPSVDFSTLHELNKTYIGETALAFRSSILRQYPFPIIEGERFIGEDIVYDKLDKEYILAVIPEYWIICEYQEGGYTNNIIKTLIRNPKGWVMSAKQKYELYGVNLKAKIRWMSTYICASIFAGFNIRHIILQSPNKFICMMCLPIGWIQKIYNQRRITQ